MKGLGIYVATMAMTMERFHNPTPKTYVKPPKSKKVRASRVKNKKARSTRKKSRR